MPPGGSSLRPIFRTRSQESGRIDLGCKQIMIQYNPDNECDMSRAPKVFYISKYRVGRVDGLEPRDQGDPWKGSF